MDNPERTKAECEQNQITYRNAADEIEADDYALENIEKTVEKVVKYLKNNKHITEEQNVGYK